MSLPIQSDSKPIHNLYAGPQFQPFSGNEPLHTNIEEQFLQVFGSVLRGEFLQETSLPPLENEQIKRLKKILATPLCFTVYGYRVEMSLRDVLKLIPDAEIQLVGSTLKYVLGNDWLTKAGKTALGNELYAALMADGSKIHPPFKKADIDIRIWLKGDTDPLKRAEKFLEAIAQKFKIHGVAQSEIRDELRKYGVGPFEVFEPRFEVDRAQTFLAAYKQGQVQVDLYFIQVLKDPITLIDEDLILSLTEYLKNEDNQLAPSGTEINGWVAALSIIGKLILPRKTDIYAWLRAMRREMEGFNFYKEKITNFTLSPIPEILIPSYIHRKNFQMENCQIFLILNMAAYNLKLEEQNHALSRFLRAIELKQHPEGFLGKLYAAAQEVGWEPVAALLKITQPLTRDGRWVQGKYSCNFDIPQNHVLQAIGELQRGGKAVAALLNELEESFSRINQRDRSTLCEIILSFHQFKEQKSLELFERLMRIDVGEALKFVRKYRLEITATVESVKILLDKLTTELPINREHPTVLEKIHFFNNLCRRLRERNEFEPLIEEAVTRAVMLLLDTKKFSACFILFEQQNAETLLIQDVSLWMTLLSHLYHKHTDDARALLRLGYQHGLWTESVSYDRQVRTFKNLIDDLVRASLETGCFDFPEHMITTILKSGIDPIHAEELKKYAQKINQKKKLLEIECKKIPDDLEKLAIWNHNPGDSLEQFIESLIGKLTDLEDHHPYLELTLDRMQLFLHNLDWSDKEAVRSLQKHFIHFIDLLKRKNVKESKYILFFLSYLEQLSHPEASNLIADSIENDRFAAAQKELIEWLKRDEHLEVAFNLIELLLDKNRQQISQEMLIHLHRFFNDEQLSAIIPRAAIDFMFTDLPRAARLIKQIFLNTEESREKLKQDIALLVKKIKSESISDSKLLALIELGKIIDRISSDEVLAFLNYAIVSRDVYLRARTWHWYRVCYHPDCYQMNDTTVIDETTNKIFVLSKKLLESLNSNSYPIIKRSFKRMLVSHQQFQNILTDRKIKQEVHSFILQDIFSITHSFSKFAVHINKQDVLKVFDLIRIHSNFSIKFGKNNKQSEILMFSVADKIINDVSAESQRNVNEFELFLGGWLILQRLLLTTHKFEPRFLDLTSRYLRCSYSFPEEFHNKIDDDILSFIAHMLTNPNHAAHKHLSIAAKKRLAKDYMSHPIVIGIPPKTSHVIYLVKAILEPLSEEENQFVNENEVIAAKQELWRRGQRILYLFYCTLIIFGVIRFSNTFVNSITGNKDPEY